MPTTLAERRSEYHAGPVGPWAAEIDITAVRYHGGRRSSVAKDWLFEVSCAWIGPPMLGMPDSDEPVNSRDIYVVPNLEDARALADRAVDAFGAGGDWAPNLRVLAGVQEAG